MQGVRELKPNSQLDESAAAGVWLDQPYATIPQLTKTRPTLLSAPCNRSKNWCQSPSRITTVTQFEQLAGIMDSLHASSNHHVLKGLTIEAMAVAGHNPALQGLEPI